MKPIIIEDANVDALKAEIKSLKAELAKRDFRIEILLRTLSERDAALSAARK